MNRQEKYAKILRLRDEGYTYREIALKLGCSFGSVKAVVNDPDGSKQKARRKRYQGRCEDCGAPTDGSNGYAKAPRWCRLHVSDHVRVWTRESVIAAIQDWAAEHGQPPRSIADWQRACPEGTHPAASSIYRGLDGKTSHHSGAPFASWNEAIEAAGFEPREIGKYERTEEHKELLRTVNLGKPGKKGPNLKLRRFDYDEARRMRDSGATISDLAVRFGVTYNGMWHALHRTYEVAA